MFLFKKKIDVIKYWQKKVDYLFSNDWLKFADFWKEQSKINLSNINADLYHNHFRAASLQLIGVVISRKNVSFERRFELETIKEEYLKQKNRYNIYNLYKEYNRLFGSSFKDGIQPMASYFSASISKNNKTENSSFFYHTFYIMLNEMFKELKPYKLV